VGQFVRHHKLSLQCRAAPVAHQQNRACVGERVPFGAGRRRQEESVGQIDILMSGKRDAKRGLVADESVLGVACERDDSGGPEAIWSIVDREVCRSLHARQERGQRRGVNVRQGQGEEPCHRLYRRRGGRRGQQLKRRGG